MTDVVERGGIFLDSAVKFFRGALTTPGLYSEGASRQLKLILDVLEEQRATIAALRSDLAKARHKMRRDGTGCGCQWTFADEKDLDGTLTRECAYHADARAEAEKRALEKAAGVADLMIEELKRIQAADYPHVKIGSHLTALGQVAESIRALKSTDTK